MDEATLGRVLDAAEPLFGERGFFRVGLDEVAEKAGVDASELAREFPDSGALVVQLAQVRAHELRAVLHQSVEGLGSRSMMEGVGFQAFFSWLGDHPHMYRIIRQSELVDREVFRRWYSDLAEDYARGLTRAMDDGEIPRGDPEALSYCLMGMGDFVGMRYILWDERHDLPAEVQRTFQRLVSRMLNPAVPGR